MIAGYILSIYLFSGDQIYLRFLTEKQCSTSLNLNIDKYGMSKIKSIDCFEIYPVEE